MLTKLPQLLSEPVVLQGLGSFGQQNILNMLLSN